MTINLINRHYYIGKNQTDNKIYLGSGIALKRAIKKYGKENFKKVILEYCTDVNHLNEREAYWINLHNATSDSNSYNIAQGGKGGNTGAYHKVGRSGPKNHMYGKTYTDEEKNAISKRFKDWHAREDSEKKKLVFLNQS